MRGNSVFKVYYPFQKIDSVFYLYHTNDWAFRQSSRVFNFFHPRNRLKIVARLFLGSKLP